MIAPTDLDWLALCLCTESDRPEEWPAVAQVIENRLKSGRWGTSLRAVVLAPMQFSAFNGVSGKIATMGHTDAWNLVAGRLGISRLLLMHAARGDWSGPWAGISKETLHYYSPVSMEPPGSKPAWAAYAKRLYTPTGVDPDRFIFAEGVP